MAIVLGSAAAGMLVSIFASSGPGLILGIFLIAGTVTAAVLIRPRIVHLLIPIPALAYLAASMIAGLAHDRASYISRTALAVHALQWLASGFLAITAAAAFVITMTVVRWWIRRRSQQAGSPGSLDPYQPIDERVPRNQHGPRNEYDGQDDFDLEDWYRSRDRHDAGDQHRARDRHGPLGRYGERDAYSPEDGYGHRDDYGPRDRPGSRDGF